VIKRTPFLEDPGAHVESKMQLSGDLSLCVLGRWALFGELFSKLFLICLYWPPEETLLGPAATFLICCGLRKK
jgi:hypothetical protein